MDQVARRGLLARAPGALIGRHFRNCQHFCRSWRGDPLEKKQIFGKKSQCRQTERGDPLGFLKTQSVVKYQRNLKGPFGEKKIIEKKSHNTEKLKGDPLGVFNLHSVAKHQKSEGENFFLIFGKNLTRPKKNRKEGPFGIFQHPFCRKTAKKMKGDPLGKKFFRKKSCSAEKNWQGDPLVSPGMVCYAGKQEKLFWFSSQGKMVQFGAIIFCRTFKNYFDQFVWIEKKESL